MRKVALLFLVLGGLLFGGQTVLIEVYQEGVLAPSGDCDTTVLSLNFSTDTVCHTLFAIGGVETRSISCLLLDGDTIKNSIRQNIDGNAMSFDQTYIQIMQKGLHTLSLRWKKITTTAQCQYGRLQALIFLPDSASAIAEQPAPEPGRSVTSAVISRGPYVSAPGASAVVDASGRVMENVLSEGRVSISNLPAGTYFAKDEERTVVKIVKVD